MPERLRMNVKKGILAVCVLISALALCPNEVIPLTNDGRNLKAVFDTSDVTHLWLRGYRVNWETGEPLGVATRENVSHCSAYVAAILKRNGIHILCPPEHKPKLLANAQYDWLETAEAQKSGWEEIADRRRYEEAQELANKGYFVVAVIKNRNPERPGHIAFIYPEEIGRNKVQSDGPNCAQAGRINGTEIPLREAFRHHYKIFENNGIKFHYNKHKIIF